MEDKEYRQQVYEGKRLIEERVKELAQKLHIEAAEHKWDEEEPVLEICSKGKSEKLEFSEENIRNYVKSINDRTRIDAHIRDLLMKLKARKGRYLGVSE